MVNKFFLFFIFLFLIAAGSVYSEKAGEAVIYKNEACGHCSGYLESLVAFLRENNFSVSHKNVINDLNSRSELDSFNKRYGIPFDMQSHMTVVINEDLVLEGHVPMKLLEQLIEKYPDKKFPKLLIYQELMREDVDTYTILEENKDVKECSIDTKITDCSKSTPKKRFWEASVFTIVLTTGLLAGVHPCTISVLLFFIAFLFTLRRTRLGIFKVGLSYILGVFIAYLFIGLGVFKALVFAEPHFAAKSAAYLVIILGLINLKGYFWPQKLFSLGIPHASKESIAWLMEKASIPASFVLGIFVGICSFGCTAGIYISILGLLLTEPSRGFFYLVMYNIMFIIPLIAILLIASNKRIVSKMEKLEQSEKDYVKLIAGFIMIALGLFILYGGVLH